MIARAAAFAVAVALAGAGSAAAQDPDFKPLRFDEDYASLLDKPDRDGWAAVKAVPLTSDGEVWLSTGGELRLRWEGQNAPDLDPAADASSVFLRRAYLHADLHAGPLRVFAQLGHAAADGRPGGPGPTDQNRLEWQNLFVELEPAEGLRLRGGRQEIRLGSGRLVDYREGPNVRRTFDGLRLDAGQGRSTLTLLALRPRRDRPGAFDDGTDTGQALWGAQVGVKDAVVKGVTLETYLLGYENERASYAQGPGRERRWSLGARLAGRRGAWDANWEAVVQTGEYGEGEILAWTVATETGRTFEAPLQPRVALSANIASGDKDPEDRDLQAFNALYPRGNYFSEDATLGPRNFVNLHPFLTLQLRPDLELVTDLNVFWRLETGDGVYGPSGVLFRGPEPGAGRHVATALSLNLTWTPIPFVDATAIYTRFEPGEFLENTGPSEPLDFVELTVRTRF